MMHYSYLTPGKELKSSNFQHGNLTYFGTGVTLPQAKDRAPFRNVNHSMHVHSTKLNVSSFVTKIQSTVFPFYLLSCLLL